ncbi:copper fist DNA binding domain-containing protein [Sporodiniella umbellata]|nr:copper fist DNA binding domain-containing protein [Sporodiniella umbellata]
MIVINNIKYACEACIQGHRSSRCNHKDRDLIMVRKKGRPVSQCENCREKRKANRVHKKCECPTKKNSLTNKNMPYFSHRSVMSIEALLI